VSKKVHKDIAEVERMLKALIKYLEKRHLNPRIPVCVRDARTGRLDPFLPINGEKDNIS
jgi:hypothetical protein